MTLFARVADRLRKSSLCRLSLSITANFAAWLTVVFGSNGYRSRMRQNRSGRPRIVILWLASLAAFAKFACDVQMKCRRSAYLKAITFKSSRMVANRREKTSR